MATANSKLTSEPLPPADAAKRCFSCGVESGNCEHAGSVNRGTARLRERTESTFPFSRVLSAGLEALELLNIGIAVTNNSRKLLFANHTAKQILFERDGLELAPDGTLSSLKRRSTPSLAELIRQVALAPAGHEPKDSFLAIRRRSGKRPLTVLVRSLTANIRHDNCGEPVVLVFIWDPELPVLDAESRLRQLFGLTSCEARLANLLMEGKTLEDCCDQLEIRTSTARMHLGNLFAKVGVQRQSQLVSLLWKSVGMVRSRYVAGAQARNGYLNPAPPSPGFFSSVPD